MIEHEADGTLLAVVDKGLRAMRWSDIQRAVIAFALIQLLIRAVERNRSLTAEETIRIRERIYMSMCNFS